MEQIQTSIEPKTIPDGATQFEANGKVYRRASSVSFNRYGWMEQFNIELSYGRSVKDIFEAQRKQWDLMNKMKFAELAVSMDDVMTGVSRIASGDPHPMFKQCALFWNYEGEDVRTMTDELMAEKLSDWEQEGIDAGFLFRQAVSNVPGLLAAYRVLTESSSETAKDEGSKQVLSPITNPVQQG